LLDRYPGISRHQPSSGGYREREYLFIWYPGDDGASMPLNLVAESPGLV
jgi:hypothetical protein